jgi:hypothetical protein
MIQASTHHALIAPLTTSDGAALPQKTILFKHINFSHPGLYNAGNTAYRTPTDKSIGGPANVARAYK